MVGFITTDEYLVAKVYVKLVMHQNIPPSFYKSVQMHIYSKNSKIGYSMNLYFSLYHDLICTLLFIAIAYRVNILSNVN